MATQTVTGADARRANDRRVRRTRQAIHDAVQTLLQETPYEKLTITAVAREADIDRKTFYLHYESLDDVIDEAVQDDVERIIGVWKDGVRDRAQPQDITETFARICALLVQELTQQSQMLANLGTDVLLSRIEGPLAAAIEREDALGVATALGSKLPYSVSFFCGGLLAVLRRWAQEDGALSLDEVGDVVSQLITSGVLGVLEGPQPA